MKKFFVILMLSAFLFSFQSCKKKEEEEPQIPAAELLTRVAWKHYKNTLFDESGNVVYTSDTEGRLVFTRTNDYFFHDEYNDVDDYGKWELLENDTKLRFYDRHWYNGDAVYKIYKLSKDELIYFREYQSGRKYVYYYERED